ncbi:glycosyl transferase, partial [Lactobacillus crispatus]|nr:glycosyl transferase [Lactobacillus crispatus]
DGIHVYPDGFLCNPSKDSYSIHLFTGTWIDGQQSVKQKIVIGLKRRISSPRQASLYQKLIRK